MPLADTGLCQPDHFCIAGFRFPGEIDCLNQLSVCFGEHLKALMQMVMQFLRKQQVIYAGLRRCQTVATLNLQFLHARNIQNVVFVCLILFVNVLLFSFTLILSLIDLTAHFLGFTM